MASLPADTGSAASKKVELSAIITKKTEITNAAGQTNTTVQEIRTDVEATIGSVGGTPTDGKVLSDSDASATTCPADDASSDAETGSSSTSDSSEHPHLSEEHDAPEVSIVQHFERTERTITNTEFPIESFELERGMDDEADVMAIDIQQIFHDMLQAGLQPRGANNKKQAPAVAKVPDPMRAAREKQIADKAKEEAARKAAKEKEAKEKAAREKAAKRAK